MKKTFQPQGGTKMHKKGEEPLIVRMKRIAEGRVDFMGLNISGLSEPSAVNSFRTFPSFFVSFRAFLWPIQLLHLV